MSRQPVKRSVLATVMLLGVTLLTGCGDSSPAPDQQPGSSPEELAGLLVVPEDLGAGWSIQQDPEASAGSEPSGVVTEEMRKMLPRIELCPDASLASQEAAGTLEWQAFRQLGLDTGESEAPPPPGERVSAHLVFVQEFLLSDDSADIEETYDALAAGMEACAGKRTEYPDGEVGQGRPFDAPPIGDARTGTREVVTEPGGQGAALWDLKTVFAREGDVLLGITVAEITTPDMQPVLDDAAVDRIMTTIADRLT